MVEDEFQEVPPKFGPEGLGMTINRGLGDYLKWLDFMPRSRNLDLARASMISWLLNYDISDLSLDDLSNNYWETFGWKLQDRIKEIPGEFKIVDLGFGTGQALLDISKLLSHFFISNSSKLNLIGIEKYDHLKNINGRRDEINKASIQLRYGDFLELPLNNGEAFRLISVYGYLSYGSYMASSDFGAKYQVRELKRVATKDSKTRLTLVPEEFDFKYDESTYFLMIDPENQARRKVRILEMLKEEGLDYETHIVFEPSLLQYPLVCEIFFPESES